MRITIANVLTGLSVTLLSLIALAIVVSLAVQYRRRHNTRHTTIRVSQQLTQNDAQRASATQRGDTTIDLENGIVEKSGDCNTANANSNSEAPSINGTALEGQPNRSRTPSTTAPIPKHREMRVTPQLNGIPLSPESPSSTSINTDTSTTASIDSNTTTSDSDSGLPSLSLPDNDTELDRPWHTGVEKLELRNDLIIAVDGRIVSGESNASASASREKRVVLGMDMPGIGTSMNGNGNHNGNGNGNANDNETNNLKVTMPQKIRWSFFGRQEFAARKRRLRARVQSYI